MLTGTVEGRFLELLVHASGAKRILEIGTFTRLLGALDGGGAAEGRPHRHARHRAEARRGRAALLRPQPARLEDHPPPRPRDSRRSRSSRASSTSSSSTPTRRATTRTTRPCCRASPRAALIAIDNTLWSGRVLDPQDERHGDDRGAERQDRRRRPRRRRAADGARRRHARPPPLAPSSARDVSEPGPSRPRGTCRGQDPTTSERDSRLSGRCACSSPAARSRTPAA